MKAVVQRVQRGSVTVDGMILADIGKGLVILLGVGPTDDEASAKKMAEKIAQMRIFPDGQRKMNISLLDAGGEALVIPQFTLFADTRRGHRPSFTDAAPPDIARPLSTFFAQSLRDLGIPTGEGEFGAHMVVEIINDGPVTISLEV